MNISLIDLLTGLKILFVYETYKTGMTCTASDGAGKRLNSRREETSQDRGHWKEKRH